MGPPCGVLPNADARQPARSIILADTTRMRACHPMEGERPFCLPSDPGGPMPAPAANLVIVETPIDDLHPDPANPRRISADELDTLTKSLRVHGFVLPILARLEDKTVIGGHQRLLAARKLGHKTVPTIFLDVDTERARLLESGAQQDQRRVGSRPAGADAAGSESGPRRRPLAQRLQRRRAEEVPEADRERGETLPAEGVRPGRSAGAG